MTHKYKVSAIVSTYKSERFIRGCLEDLIEQTLYQQDQLEIIVIDSNSPENETEIVKEFQATYPHIIYQRTPERETLYAAWNRAIKLSSGEYITNANTDDRFAPTALELMSSKLESSPGIDAIYGDWVVTKVENDTFNSGTEKYIFRYPEFFPPMLFYHQITSHSAMLRKDVFAKIGLYDKKFKVYGDREFMFRFANAGLKAKHTNQIIGLYLDHCDNLGKSSEAAITEFVPLRTKYLSPDHITCLFDQPQTKDPIKLSQLYATIGSLAKGVHYWEYQPINDFYFAVDPLQRALELNNENLLALNNLAIFLCLQQNYNRGIKLFKAALSSHSLTLSCRLLVEANINAALQSCQDLEGYYWLRPDYLDALVDKPNIRFVGFSDEATSLHNSLDSSNLVTSEILSLAAFPDWSQPAEDLIEDLVFAIKYVYEFQQQSSQRIELWINNSGIFHSEDSNQILETALFNFLLDQDPELNIDNISLSLTDRLSKHTCETIYRKSTGRVLLRRENLKILKEFGIKISVHQNHD